MSRSSSLPSWFFPRWLCVLLLLLVAAPGVGHAQQDPRAVARAHYEEGKRLYSAGDYHGAISAYARAEQASPSPFNDFNVALCYDKLGEADFAVQFYRSYLGKVPSAQNRSAVEASIARLEAALRAARDKDQARKAEEARRAEEARKAEERRQQEEARAAETARILAEAEAQEKARQAEQARLAAEAKAQEDARQAPQPSGAGAFVSSGDPAMDRVAAIDVNAIRDQRRGSTAFAGSGQVGVGPEAAAPAGAPSPRQPDRAPGARPVYKQWWFWAVVGVGTIVALSIVTADDNGNGRRFENSSPAQQASSGGATLFRF